MFNNQGSMILLNKIKLATYFIVNNRNINCSFYKIHILHYEKNTF